MCCSEPPLSHSFCPLPPPRKRFLKTHIRLFNTRKKFSSHKQVGRHISRLVECQLKGQGLLQTETDECQPLGSQERVYINNIYSPKKTISYPVQNRVAEPPPSVHTLENLPQTLFARAFIPTDAQATFRCIFHPHDDMAWWACAKMTCHASSEHIQKLNSAI